MSIRTSCRFGMALLLAALVSGCSLLGAEGSGAGSSGAYSASSDECRWNRSQCIYEGAYEPGERDYAEQEAKALNRAALEKLRRNANR